MRKPHIRFIYGRWWAFNSRREAYQRIARDWHGCTIAEAYRSWARFNTMKL